MGAKASCTLCGNESKLPGMWRQRAKSLTVRHATADSKLYSVRQQKKMHGMRQQIANCTACPCAIQFAICCRTAMCRTVCYLLLHCHVPYSLLFVAALPHAVQFAICCCMPYSLLFVAALPSAATNSKPYGTWQCSNK